MMNSTFFARRSASVLFLSFVGAIALVSCGGDGGAAGAGGVGGAVESSSSGPKPTEHACFSTEATCDGKCVNLSDNPQHCGACDTPCSAASDQVGQCVEGACVFKCNTGFVDDNGICKNLLGAFEPFPNDCQGCSTANQYTTGCGCPPSASPLSLAVESDCPGMPIRQSTRLNLCVTSGVSDQSDFGGAYQVDDLDGQCGAAAKCRVGNPFAGGACACPPGMDEPITLRSIVHLPCEGETGTLVVLCGKAGVKVRSYGGAYQYDDFDPMCRVGNPKTGGCSCPAGTTDRVFRVMVDGPPGLYGSTIHLCTP